jgi:hypothetical protein
MISPLVKCILGVSPHCQKIEINSSSHLNSMVSIFYAVYCCFLQSENQLVDNISQSYEKFKQMETFLGALPVETKLLVSVNCRTSLEPESKNIEVSIFSNYNQTNILAWMV